MESTSSSTVLCMDILTLLQDTSAVIAELMVENPIGALGIILFYWKWSDIKEAQCSTHWAKFWQQCTVGPEVQ